MIFTITKSRLRMEIVRSFYSQTLTVSLTRLQLKNSTRMEVKILKISSTQVIALKSHVSGIPTGCNKKVVGMMVRLVERSLKSLLD